MFPITDPVIARTSGILDGWLFILVMVGFGLITAFHYFWEAALERKLPPLAESFGLTYTRHGGQASTVLVGHYRAIHVTMFEEIRGSGKHRRTHSFYHIRLNPGVVPAGLTVYRETLTAKMGKALGGDDIVVGKPKLDKAFIIRGALAKDCQEFFARPHVEDYFLELLDLCKDFRLENNLLMLEYNQRIARKHDQLRTLLEALTRCAHAIAQTDPKLSAHQLANAPKAQAPTQPTYPQPLDPIAAPVSSRPEPSKPLEDTNIHW